MPPATNPTASILKEHIKNRVRVLIEVCARRKRTSFLDRHYARDVEDRSVFACAYNWNIFLVKEELVDLFCRQVINSFRQDGSI